LLKTNKCPTVSTVNPNKQVDTNKINNINPGPNPGNKCGVNTGNFTVNAQINKNGAINNITIPSKINCTNPVVILTGSTSYRYWYATNKKGLVITIEAKGLTQKITDANAWWCIDGNYIINLATANVVTVQASTLPQYVKMTNVVTKAFNSSDITQKYVYNPTQKRFDLLDNNIYYLGL
jgi:hypothetical protein